MAPYADPGHRRSGGGSKRVTAGGQGVVHNTRYKSERRTIAATARTSRQHASCPASPLRAGIVLSELHTAHIGRQSDIAFITAAKLSCSLRISSFSNTTYIPLIQLSIPFSHPSGSARGIRPACPTRAPPTDTSTSSPPHSTPPVYACTYPSPSPWRSRPVSSRQTARWGRMPVFGRSTMPLRVRGGGRTLPVRRGVSIRSAFCPVLRLLKSIGMKIGSTGIWMGSPFPRERDWRWS